MPLLDKFLYGQPQASAGLLSPAPAAGGFRDFLNNNGATLLALGAGIAGGDTLGEGLSRGFAGAAQVAQNKQELDLKREVLRSKATTDDIREYNFARQQGFKGSFVDYMNQGGKNASLTPVFGTDAQGNTVLLQPMRDGRARVMQVPEGIAPQPGVTFQDLGTHIAGFNKKTGQPVGTFKKDVAGAEREKAVGKGEGEARVGLPKAIGQADQMLDDINDTLNDPALDSATGLQEFRQLIPGTATKRFGTRVKKLQGAAFLQAFQQLKGGGHITEIEGVKATQAIARLDTSQSADDFRQALRDLRDVVRIGKQRAMLSAQGAAPAQSGVRKWNPTTGLE